MVSSNDTWTEFSVSFPSAVVTGYPENDSVSVRAFVPRANAPVPVVVILHYWGASDQRGEVSLAATLCQQGVAAVLVPLPYHLTRTPAGHRSGEMAIVPDVTRLVSTMNQGASDVRRTIDWIGTRPEFDPKRIGIEGTSLGSIVGALVYGLDYRIAAASFVLGGADIAHILWHSSRVVAQRDNLRRQGYTETKLREALTDIEPLNYLPRLTPTPAFVVAARFDTVVPPVDVTKLLEQLPGAQALWLDTGHYGGVFVQRRVQRLVADFFTETFAGRSFVAPKHLYAPTVRIGVSFNSSTRLQVGVGIDVWRTPRGDTFATLMATPKGIQGFAGFRLSQGLSVGGFISNRRVGAGVLWSTVL